MIPKYNADTCRAGGNFARRDDGFDAVQTLVDVAGVDGLEAFALYFRRSRPNGTRAEFTRLVISLVHASERDPYLKPIIDMRAAA